MHGAHIGVKCWDVSSEQQHDYWNLIEELWINNVAFCCLWNDFGIYNYDKKVWLTCGYLDKKTCSFTAEWLVIWHDRLNNIKKQLLYSILITTVKTECMNECGNQWLITATATVTVTATVTASHLRDKSHRLASPRLFSIGRQPSLICKRAFSLSMHHWGWRCQPQPRGLEWPHSRAPSRRASHSRAAETETESTTTSSSSSVVAVAVV